MWCVHLLAELIDKMEKQRRPNGATENIGPVLIEWV